jgi:SPX domain protein involved in polyphosphate accumulation
MTNTPTTVRSGTFAQRVEHKFWLPAAELDRTIATLQSFIPVYRFADGGWASVRTVCLDTGDLRCYRDYLDGLKVRWKIRIRQYGEHGRFDDRCWVEVKMKNRGIGSKRRFTCGLDDLSRLLHGTDISGAVMDANGPEAFLTYGRLAEMIRQRQLRPKVRIDYERLSFQHSLQDPVRITLDRDLRFCSADLAQTGSMQGLVLELKYSSERPEWFRELYSAITLHRAHRFSKYAKCIGALNRDINSGALA